ncbi:uncharacterized protein LOC127098127 [Lathyrus oleraceus]|uniref:uncharacterized protein LOC127098127 n=1 Tax=Pisum sativum TaxID=3888 RepID=UPI0021CEB87A|nr:uncharacterized protein LOC127098127 [Pisum sativum]
MSESVGSNAFPAEGKKSHYKKRNRQEVESGDRSTTQQSFKMTKHLHFEDSLPVQETEMLYSGEFLPVQETERLYSGEFLPVQETQPPEERFQAVDPKSKELLDTYEPQIVLDHPSVFHIVEIAAKKKIFYYPPRGYSDAEAKLIRKKILKKRKISVTDEEVKRVMKCLHFKFDLYCWNMQRGFQGVKFDYDSGTFSQVINLKANSPDLREAIECFTFEHKYAILYFKSFKVIFKETFLKHGKSLENKEKKASSKKLINSIGRASGSGATSDDTFKSVKKPPRSTTSLKAIVKDYEAHPPELDDLVRRINRLFDSNYNVIKLTNTLVRAFVACPDLAELYRNYDDNNFKTALINLASIVVL